MRLPLIHQIVSGKRNGENKRQEYKENCFSLSENIVINENGFTCFWSTSSFVWITIVVDYGNRNPPFNCCVPIEHEI